MSIANQSRKFATYNHPLFTSNLFVDISSSFKVFSFVKGILIKIILEEYKKNIAPYKDSIHIILLYIYYNKKPAKIQILAGTVYIKQNQ